MHPERQPVVEISIEALSKLARLSLSEQERELFAKQLGDILKYMNTLNELDTHGVEPTSHVIALKNITRADIPEVCLDRADALSNAPDHTEKFYRVPKIIE